MTALDHPMPMPDVDAPAFRAVFRQLAGAVSVITAGSGDGRAGLTATSMSSLSVEPPTILVCVNRGASALPTILEHRHFCVNILSDRQQDVADRFAGRGGLRGAERFQGADWTVLATGAPALVGALGNVDAELEEVIERHSHAILIGRVKAAVTTGVDGALTYWQGGFVPLQKA